MDIFTRSGQERSEANYSALSALRLFAGEIDSTAKTGLRNHGAAFLLLDQFLPQPKAVISDENTCF